MSQLKSQIPVLYLHPIMFLLNRLLVYIKHLFLPHLHPIMFLLNLNLANIQAAGKGNLHPIMFLLNLFNSSTDKLKLLRFTSHYVPIKSHTNIILYFLPFSTHFLSTTAKTSQADVRNLLNYLLTTLLKPHESMDCQLPHKNALS